MIRTRAILVICFVFVFAAGAAVSRLNPVSVEQPHEDRRDRFARELGLTEEQRQDIRKIWDNAREKTRQQDWRQQKSDIRAERDRAILELMGDDMYGKYQSIRESYEARTDAVDDERRAIFRAAREKMLELFTSEQLQKFQDMESRHHSRRDGPDRRDQQKESSNNSNGSVQ